VSAAAPRRGIPFVVAAPSGTGKTTVCRRLLEADPDLVFSVSHTTRPRRPGERDGVDYRFVAEAEFERLVREGAFLEWAVYNGNRYGTSWEAIEAPLAGGCDVLLEIEVQGARQVRRRLPEARLVFLLPPSLAALEARLSSRGANSPGEIAERLETARGELAAIREFDYAVVNEELDRCVSDVLSIVRAERAAETTSVRARFDPRPAALRFSAATA
jgi:guanylate kinase